MATKLKIFVILLIGLIIIHHDNYGQAGDIINSQDPYWYIRNNRGATQYNSGTNSWTFGTSNISNKFKINGQNGIATTEGKQNMFIITDDGKFILQKYTNQNSLGNGAYRFYLNGGSPPKYMNFLIRYEDDNPPSKQVQNDPDANVPLNNTVTDTMLLTHKLYRGKDVVLIIPNNFECTNKLLIYNNNAFALSNIFKDPNATASMEAYSFPQYSTSFISPGQLQLNNSNVGPYYYVNFHVRDIELGDSLVRFYCGCQDINTKKINNIYSLSDTLRDPDDPNYIELLSINKENNDYWAVYHVECYNNGDDYATEVSIEMNMPTTVNVNTAKLLNWKAGSFKGPLNKIIFTNDGKIKMIYKHDRHDLENYVSGEILERHKAWFEFKVKINSNDENQIMAMNLRPLNPITNFNGHTFVIEKYIDGCRETLMGNANDCSKLFINEVDTGWDAQVCNSKWCWILLCICIILLVLCFFFRRS